MSWESPDPIVQVLHTVGNPIRKAAIEALRKDGMRFSELLASCSLDYDHDAGHFYYHLSELMNKQIVKKVGNTYCLTELGSKIAEMLSSIETECSFLFGKRSKGGEREMDIRKIETGWIEFGELVPIPHSLRFIKETGFLGQFPEKTCFPTKGWDFRNELPDGPERRRLTEFEEEFRSWRGPRTFMAKDKDMILGWAVISYRVAWRIPEKERGDSEIFARTSIVIESLAVAPWTKADRKEVALSLLKELLSFARQKRADKIQLMNVNADDSAVIEVLRESGFERVATNYLMKKTLAE